MSSQFASNIDLYPLPSSEIQNNFGQMVDRTESSNTIIVVERRGRRTIGLVDYQLLLELLELRQVDLKRKAFKELERLRKKVQTPPPSLDPVEAYAMAGFSQDLAREMVESDKQLSKVLT